MNFVYVNKFAAVSKERDHNCMHIRQLSIPLTSKLWGRKLLELLSATLRQRSIIIPNIIGNIIRLHDSILIAAGIGGEFVHFLPFEITVGQNNHCLFCIFMLTGDRLFQYMETKHCKILVVYYNKYCVLQS